MVRLKHSKVTTITLYIWCFDRETNFRPIHWHDSFEFYANCSEILLNKYLRQSKPFQNLIHLASSSSWNNRKEQVQFSLFINTILFQFNTISLFLTFKSQCSIVIHTIHLLIWPIPTLCIYFDHLIIMFCVYKD